MTATVDAPAAKGASRFLHLEASTRIGHVRRMGVHRIEPRGISPHLPEDRRGEPLIFDNKARPDFLLTGRCPARPTRRAAIPPEDPCQRESTSPNSH
jgi:hypothetical protein